MQTMLEFGMKFMSFEKHKSVVAVEKHESAEAVNNINVIVPKRYIRR